MRLGIKEILTDQSGGFYGFRSGEKARDYRKIWSQ